MMTDRSMMMMGGCVWWYWCVVGFGTHTAVTVQIDFDAKDIIIIHIIIIFFLRVRFQIIRLVGRRHLKKSTTFEIF